MKLGKADNRWVILKILVIVWGAVWAAVLDPARGIPPMQLPWPVFVALGAVFLTFGAIQMKSGLEKAEHRRKISDPHFLFHRPPGWRLNPFKGEPFVFFFTAAFLMATWSLVGVIRTMIVAVEKGPGLFLYSFGLGYSMGWLLGILTLLRRRREWFVPEAAASDTGAA